MSATWVETTLGHVVALQRGHDLPTQSRSVGAVPIMGSAGVSGYHNQATTKGPGVVVGRSGVGSMGVVSYSDQDFWALNTTLFVKDFKGNDERFVFYLLSTINFRQFDTGSAQASLNRNVVYTHRVNIPGTVREQKAIAGVLWALDDRIALLRETNATLEAIAQALFKSWFVDFDPVRAKQQGLPPAGMDEATAALFPDGFEQSAMGPLPRGWRAPTLAEAFDINPLRSLRKGAEAKYLEMAAAPTSGHCAGSVAVRAFGSGTKFRNGDTLLARITPCLENGKTAFVDFLVYDEVGWGSTEFIVLRPRAPLPEYWAYLLCRHAPFREFAERSMSGTSGRQRVQNDVLGTFQIAVPPADVAKAFESIVVPLQQTIAGNHERAATLASLRDTLLPRLISGQLRLPLAQEAIAEATHAD